MALRRAGLLDDAGRAQFQRLVELVRSTLGVPVAVITLVEEDHQFFAGHEGLPEPWSTFGRTPLSHSFCQHVVARTSPITVVDARSDTFFCGNPAIEEIGVVAYAGVPLALDGGEVIGALAAIDTQPKVWTESDLAQLYRIAEIVMHEFAVRKSETKWRTAFDEMQEAFGIGSALRDADRILHDVAFEEGNPAFAALVGERANPSDHGDVFRLFGEMATAVLARLDDVLGSGTPATFEVELPHHPGEWFEMRVRRLEGDRVAVLLMRITERRRAAIDLARAEERRRLAIETGDVGLWEIDLRTKRLRGDPRSLSALGLTADEEEVPLARALASLHYDDRAAFTRDLTEIARGRDDHVELQYRVAAQGRERWLLAKGRILRDAQGVPASVVGAVRDVTDRIEADLARQMVASELSHRLKNNLAVVQSIVTQTLRTSPDLDVARRSLTGRIQALSKAHDILLTGTVETALIRQIVEGALLPHDDRLLRCRIVGEDFHIDDKMTLSLALVLNELATNAGKYGALQAEHGIVHLTWERIGPAGAQVLRIEWREEGGPPVVPPTRTGFGSRLIRMGLSSAAGSEATLDYEPAGLRCVLVAPLSRETAEPG
ncbi:MAG: HWE histidine kinase domain-containing protein [Methylobacterium sp.]